LRESGEIKREREREGEGEGERERQTATMASGKLTHSLAI
jgi:hypothetical protein